MFELASTFTLTNQTFGQKYPGKKHDAGDEFAEGRVDLDELDERCKETFVPDQSAATVNMVTRVTSTAPAELSVLSSPAG